jgi:cyclophilin family peptidyl-prolyl cis-trans isomerase
LTALAAVACLALPAAAQDTSPAQLWHDLDQILPRKGSATPAVFASASIDWPAKIAQTEEFMVRAGGTPLEPFAMYYLASFLFEAGRIDEALALFETVKSQFPEHPLVRFPVADQKSIVDQAIEDCSSEKSFRTRYPRAASVTPVLDEKLTATLHFSTGDVKIGFYSNVAPNHIANFLKRAEAGDYAGTKVGQVIAEMLVNLGDPTTKGAGPNQPPIPNREAGAQHHEFSNLSHVRGAVAMSRGPTESGLESFQIILKDQPHYDFQQTIFGRVIEGLEVVDAISRMPKDQYQRPSPEVVLEKVTVSRK